MYENHIADITLAPEGEKKIRWAAGHMPVLAAIAEDFRETKPLAGLRVALSVHLEAKTAYLCRVTGRWAARKCTSPAATRSPRRTTWPRPSPRAVSRSRAEYGASEEEYSERASDAVLAHGAEYHNRRRRRPGRDHAHRCIPELCADVIGGCEETTTGIHRLRKLVPRRGRCPSLWSRSTTPTASTSSTTATARARASGTP